MNDAYYDLVAFRDLGSTVEELYRAFLDVKLIEMASEGLAGYQKRVTAFRRKHLSEYDRAKISPDTGIELAPDKQTELERLAQFLYWFDLRTEYWARNYVRAKELDPKLDSAEKLKMLHADVKRLQDRLEKRAELKPMALPPPGHAAPKPDKDPEPDRERLLWYLGKMKPESASGTP